MAAPESADALGAICYSCVGIVAALYLLAGYFDPQAPLWVGCLLFGPVGFILLSLLGTAVLAIPLVAERTLLGFQGTTMGQRFRRSIYIAGVSLPVLQLIVYGLLALLHIRFFVSHWANTSQDKIALLLLGLTGALCGIYFGYFLSLIHNTSARKRVKYICLSGVLWAVFSLDSWILCMLNNRDASFDRFFHNTFKAQPTTPPIPMPTLPRGQDPNKDGKAHTKLGLVLQTQRKLAEAIAEYHKAIDLHPKLANAHVP
jgi:hypothetical protein